MNVINHQAVKQLCKIVGLPYEAVNSLKIDVELPGVVTATATFYVLPETQAVDTATTKETKGKK